LSDLSKDKPIRNLVFTNIEQHTSPSMSLASKSPMVSDGGNKNLISIRRYSNSQTGKDVIVDGGQQYVLSSRREIKYQIYNYATNESSRSQK
jgi:hypothetical protein